MLERFGKGAELVGQPAFSGGGSFGGAAEQGGKERGESQTGGRAFEKAAAAGDGGVVHVAMVSVLAGLGKS